MRCDEVQSQLMRYVDRRLAEDRARKVDAHLDVCPRCQRLYADEVELVAAFHEEGRQRAGDALVADVMRQVEQVAATAGADSRSLIRIRPAAMVALAAAAAAALAAWWQVGIPTWSGWLASVPLRNLVVRLAAVQQAVADGAATVRTALHGASAAIAHWFGAGDTLVGTSAQGQSTQIALFTLLAAVSCVGLVLGFQSRHAKEM